MKQAGQTSDPIVVPASPTATQLVVGIRQAALAVGVILSTMGFTALAGQAGLVASLAPQIATLVVIVGPLLAGGAAWLGQIATRKQVQKAAALANLLPDEKATTK